jgi:hypothetical protein
VIPNARLCKALLDRITDRAHIIETGSESYRFRPRKTQGPDFGSGGVTVPLAAEKKRQLSDEHGGAR